MKKRSNLRLFFPKTTSRELIMPTSAPTQLPLKISQQIDADVVI